MIGDRIRYLREQNNLTQTQLSKILGISRSAVNAWEMSISTPSVVYLVQLAQLFHVSTDYILCLDNSLVIEVESLTEQEKNIIFELLKYFSESKETR